MEPAARSSYNSLLSIVRTSSLTHRLRRSALQFSFEYCPEALQDGLEVAEILTYNSLLSIVSLWGPRILKGPGETYNSLLSIVGQETTRHTGGGCNLQFSFEYCPVPRLEPVDPV